MAKFTDDSVLDAALDDIATSTVMHLCSSQPANYAAVAGASLADVALTGVDFTNANGDVSGRKVTVAAKSGVTVDATGTGNHVALVTGSVLKHVTTCNSIAVTSGGTVDFPAFDIEFADVTP